MWYYVVLYYTYMFCYAVYYYIDLIICITVYYYVAMHYFRLLYAAHTT